MSKRIGLLLPRSTDYPGMGFDILDGLRCSLGKFSSEEVELVTENIGFGENDSVNYAKAEKLILQDRVEAIVMYSNSLNAEALYQLAEASSTCFIFLDAGMQVPQGAPSSFSYHISLQGIHACRLAGYMA